MKVLVDTSVWSEAFRRQPGEGREGVTSALERLIQKGLAELTGSIRQELLSGISDTNLFEFVKQKLRGFPDVPVHSDDYEQAAELYNRCRGKGVQGSHGDMLICAVALRRQSAIFTLDRDFGHYAKTLPIKLYRWE